MNIQDIARSIIGNKSQTLDQRADVFNEKIKETTKPVTDTWRGITEVNPEQNKIVNLARSLFFPQKGENDAINEYSRALALYSQDKGKFPNKELQKAASPALMNYAGLAGNLYNQSKVPSESISNLYKARDISNSADEVIDIAKAQQPGFKKLVSYLANELGLDFSVGPIKNKGRILEKAVKEESGNLKNIKDINRSVVFIDDFSNSHDEIINNAKKILGDKVERVKIGKDDPLFKKTIINVIGDKGQSTEIQFTTKKMWDAKINYGDDLYHKYRSITDSSVEEAKKLYNEMYDLYQNAL